MAGGYYVRRGAKVIGPFDATKLRELIARGQVVETDEFSQSAEGPWITGRQAPKLFPSAKPAALQPAPQVAQPPAVIEEPEPKSAGPVFVMLRVGKQAAVGALRVSDKLGRAVMVATGAMAAAIRVSSQRRHEIKLAKIQAKADVDKHKAQVEASRPQPVYREPAPQPAAPHGQTIVFAPIMQQQTVVETIFATPERKRGCGCSGCLLIVLLAFIAMMIIGAISDPQSPGTRPAPVPSQPSTETPGKSRDAPAARPSDRFSFRPRHSGEFAPLEPARRRAWPC